MVKVTFSNASVRDHGYGLEVNGKSLSDIISEALGTKVGDSYGYGSGLPEFSSNSCDISVVINPHPVTCEIETDTYTWASVQDMEEEMANELYTEKATEGKG